MSAIVDCPACQWGDHDRHVGPWNVTPGLLGGACCGCVGDCDERYEQVAAAMAAVFTVTRGPESEGPS